jgi:NADH dehydrogenase
VELAGAFSELINQVLTRDYPRLDTERAQVILVEATDRLLAAFPEPLQKSAQRKLEGMGVQLKFSSPVESVEDGLVTFKDGSQLQASTVVWAAGVRAAALADALDVPKAKGARVNVEPTLNLSKHPEAFVVGDMAYLEGYNGNQAYPMVAQVAIQQGKQAASNILRKVKGDAMRPFHYFDKGNMATIGRRAAVLDAFGIQLSGRLAWLGWLLIHIYYLIGFRNRLIVLTNWVFNYFAFERGVRLITNRNWPR